MGVNDGVVIGISKIVNHGEDGVNWNLVIAGDGYTATEQSSFAGHAQAFIDLLQTMPPFDDLWDDINVHRLDVHSNESGADNPELCGDGSPALGGATEANTYFDASFCTNRIRRLISINADLVEQGTLENPASPGCFPEWTP